MRICILYKGGGSLVEKYMPAANYIFHKVSFLDDYQTQLKAFRADIVILDITQSKGDKDDVYVVEQIQQLVKVPIFLIVGKNEEATYRGLMLDAGVDGCVQVPFMKEELFARLKNLVQKNLERLFRGTVVESRGVHMDIRTHEVEVGGKKLNLTKTEYGILFHLFLHRQSVVNANELRMYINDEIQDYSAALNVHILNLRRKLGRKEVIRTIPHCGFIASEQPV
ncbi:MAG: winged helix-turn-helix domain-containing protein [Candidatus Pacebacteria bacterium]|nr:winged helix-turn-helix domain-containing protein [Candidatus Paceibacterota bacterium]